MANHARGETQIEVDGVGTVKLCMTVGAMAELEDHFEVENIQEVMQKVGSNPSSRNMAAILKALMVGTEHADKPVDEIRKWPISPVAIREAMEQIDKEAGNGSSGGGNRQQRRKAAAKEKKGK